MVVRDQLAAVGYLHFNKRVSEGKPFEGEQLAGVICPVSLAGLQKSMMTDWRCFCR